MSTILIFLLVSILLLILIVIDYIENRKTDLETTIHITLSTKLTNIPDMFPDYQGIIWYKNKVNIGWVANENKMIIIVKPEYASLFDKYAEKFSKPWGP